MKLEIEYPAAPSTNSSVKFRFIAADDDSASSASEMLEAGVRYAKDGKREEARHLLLRAAALEPQNETAWLWLASLSEYPEELLVFLQNVLNINPANDRAIEWQKATRSLLANAFVERGIAAAQENRKDYANQCFMQALLHDNQNETAWLRLAANTDAPDEKAAHLEKVLSINPENETALASLNSLKHQISQSLLKKANFAAISGERDEARRLLEEAMRDAPEIEEVWILKAYLADADDEKIACYEKILELNPENETAQAGLASLQALMQKAAAQKSNAETLLEVFAKHHPNDLTGPATAVEIPESAQEMPGVPENPAAINEQMSEEPQASAEKEISPANFAFETSPVDSFESPTDELDAKYVEEIRSRGAFAQEPPLAWENFQPNDAKPFEEVSKPDDADGENENLLPFVSFEPVENIPGNFEAENLLPAVEPLGEEISSFEMQPAELVLPEVLPAEMPQEMSFSQTSQTPGSFETTHPDQTFLNEANANSENFAARWETFSQAAALEDGKPATAETDSNATSKTPPTAPAKETAFHKSHAQPEFLTCPFCYATNEPQAFLCASCRSMLSLSDMEMILAHNGANPEVVSMAIEDLEGEKAARSLSEIELTNLGIAHLNAKNLRQALACLQEATQIAPNNIVLASKVNFLAIRLAELEAQESRHEAEPQLRNLTIMVVDDSPTVRKLISGKLEKCGHTVVAAENGAEALDKIKQVVPDLILLDIMMPQMDGYQVCKLIRSYDPTKDVPVVMISGKDGFFDKARARMAGTSGYITKPFGPETLMKTIETYVV